MRRYARQDKTNKLTLDKKNTQKHKKQPKLNLNELYICKNGLFVCA